MIDTLGSRQKMIHLLAIIILFYIKLACSRRAVFPCEGLKYPSSSRICTSITGRYLKLATLGADLPSRKESVVLAQGPHKVPHKVISRRELPGGPEGVPALWGRTLSPWVLGPMGPGPCL